jgi:DNA-binding transcriptional MerR regulator
MKWTTQGSATYAQRKRLFETRKEAVEEEIRQLKKTLDMLKYKCWYYETAIADGGEERISSMLPDHLPPGIQKLYDNGHG